MTTAPCTSASFLENTGVLPDITAVFKAHHDFVWRILIHRGIAQAELPDALQEVFVVVHRRFAEYREQDKLRSWLYAITVRVARGYRRRGDRRREQLMENLPELIQTPVQSDELAKREGVQLACRMLEALPPKQLEVFLLFEVEQMSMSEIAAAIGCPVATAHARLRLARARVLSLVTRAQRRGDIP